MNRSMMEEFHRTRDLYQEIDRSARRERARAIQAGFNWLVTQVKARLTPSFRPSRWIARLG